ncbi:MAG: hypothetical protein DRO11_04530 [Methanobacteriota archaeon]|nr:MAG: hypothetical protein DRO11_04530 [Euryarchaeota archaeon]
MPKKRTKHAKRTTVGGRLRERMIKLRQQGKTFDYISKKLGVDYDVVAETLIAWSQGESQQQPAEEPEEEEEPRRRRKRSGMPLLDEELFDVEELDVGDEELGMDLVEED